MLSIKSAAAAYKDAKKCFVSWWIRLELLKRRESSAAVDSWESRTVWSGVPLLRQSHGSDCLHVTARRRGGSDGLALYYLLKGDSLFLLLRRSSGFWRRYSWDSLEAENVIEIGRDSLFCSSSSSSRVFTLAGYTLRGVSLQFSDQSKSWKLLRRMFHVNIKRPLISFRCIIKKSYFFLFQMFCP